MKFVFGGSFQGKLDFVAEQLVQEGKIPQKAQISALTAEGEICAWEAFFAKPVIHHLEQAIWRGMAEEQDPYAFVEELLHQNPDVWIIMDEVGSGIVPLDADIRRWRETVGRISCLLSQEATDVYRVLCGIPRCLKKEGVYVSN